MSCVHICTYSFVWDYNIFFFFHFQNAATPVSMITCSSCCVLWSHSLPNTNFFTQFTLPPLAWFTQNSLVSARVLTCMQPPCSSTWGQWSISHSHYKSLISHPVSLSSYIKYKHNQSRAVPSSSRTAQPHSHTDRCVCGFGSGSINPIEPRETLSTNASTSVTLDSISTNDVETLTTGVGFVPGT